jgi:hypothetical protein
MLANGILADATDEYCHTGESTAIEAMKHFTIAIRKCFEGTFLWTPTRADFEKQVARNISSGFLGMFASLDCMHWTWKNCPVAWQGQFQDKDGHFGGRCRSLPVDLARIFRLAKWEKLT